MTRAASERTEGHPDTLDPTWLLDPVCQRIRWPWEELMGLATISVLLALCLAGALGWL